MQFLELGQPDKMIFWNLKEVASKKKKPSHATETKEIFDSVCHASLSKCRLFQELSVKENPAQYPQGVMAKLEVKYASGRFGGPLTLGLSESSR